MEARKKLGDEATYSGSVLTRQGEEWIGRSEQVRERTVESRTTSIRYLMNSIELSEKDSVREPESKRDIGKIDRKMHFDSSKKLLWGQVGISLGSWGFPIPFDMQEENGRIAKSLSEIDKPGADLRKLADGAREASTTIIGGFPAAVYVTFSVDDASIIRSEKTVINVTGNLLAVDVEKSYERGRQHSFKSISVEMSYENGPDKTRLSTSFSVESEEGAIREFLSQKPAANWEREMELKARSLG